LAQELTFLAELTNPALVCQALYLCDAPNCYSWQQGTNGNCYLPVVTPQGIPTYQSYEQSQAICCSLGGHICTLDETLRTISPASNTAITTAISSGAVDPNPTEGFRWLGTRADYAYVSTVPQGGNTPPSGARPWAVTGFLYEVSDGSNDLYQLAIGPTGTVDVVPHIALQNQDLYYTDTTIPGSVVSQLGAVVCCREPWSANEFWGATKK